ncbi:histidine kinase [Pedobacter sp. UBA5917]|jgi:hypothetical protein|uniref:histidine kinase n=1 Tax=Pedobacter sp. UBA5917 TaxID=1947061 RepID=UPI0025D0DB32|nr:sensor histidine kinase [Pedobacter sp. UBA5917]
MKTAIFLLFFAILCTSCKRQVLYDEFDPVFKTGDSLAWSAKKFDEKGWSVDRGFTGKNIFWSRSNVKLISNSGGRLGLQIGAFGAYEVYWDGVKIGTNGKLGSPSQPEIPGTECKYFLLPDSLSQVGMHKVALRTTQFRYPMLQRGVGFKLDTYINLIKIPLIISSLMFIMAGAFFIAFFYYAFLYFNSHKRSYPVLIFSVICLLFFSLLIMEYIKYYIEIPYPEFFVRLEIIGWLTFSISLLVPLYFSIQFSLKRKFLLLSALLLTLVSIYIYQYGHYDISARYYSFAMWITTMLIVLEAIYREEKGSFLVLVGMLASAVMNSYMVYDFGIFIFYTFIVFAMLYLHTVKMREIEQAHESSLLLSSRLQLELIKKNIQPHFIKNTLTSLMDWVEDSPKQGAEFIQALAAEFDIMNKIAEESLIPIRQEISLCQMHLKVMGFRKEIAYQWEDFGIKDTELIPPAVIHTLLENGITHNAPIKDGFMKFRLAFSEDLHTKEYVFETIGENREPSEERIGGGGFKYIRARLEESYPGRWTFSSMASNHGWISKITLSNHAI